MHVITAVHKYLCITLFMNSWLCTWQLSICDFFKVERSRAQMFGNHCSKRSTHFCFAFVDLKESDDMRLFILTPFTL